MLGDADAHLVVAPAATRDRLPEIPVLYADAVSESERQFTPVPVDPDQAAYLIFTSGSTGRPKGTVLTHRGIRNRLLATGRRDRLGAGDRLLHKTSISFDVAVWELFAPLAAGAALELARRRERIHGATVERKEDSS
jgi:non-ribosomal peptide synthetase component F